jgi:hypothetical protein
MEEPVELLRLIKIEELGTPDEGGESWPTM